MKTRSRFKLVISPWSTGKHWCACQMNSILISFTRNELKCSLIDYCIDSVIFTIKMLNQILLIDAVKLHNELPSLGNSIDLYCKQFFSENFEGNFFGVKMKLWQKSAMLSGPKGVESDWQW